MNERTKILHDALKEIQSGNCPAPFEMADEGLLKYHSMLAAKALLEFEQARDLQWNTIQVASWIGSQLMHEPTQFERGVVVKFVRSLGRHPVLMKHSE